MSIVFNSCRCVANYYAFYLTTQNARVKCCQKCWWNVEKNVKNVDEVIEIKNADKSSSMSLLNFPSRQSTLTRDDEPNTDVGVSVGGEVGRERGSR